MKRTNLLVALVVAVVVVGGGATYFITRDRANGTQSTSMAKTDSASGLSKQAESDTYKKYAALKGEDYDRMFLADMIAHHQGAIDMANLAKTNAKHAELKSLANAIVTDQNKEKMDMSNWQATWGYPASSGGAMTDHSSMSMGNDMASMMTQLDGKTGDDFDKTFLSLMIQHHQSAIDMAKPGANNASHKEIKDLSAAIVSAQSQEIDQMKQWQGDWGYTASSSSTSMGHDM